MKRIIILVTIILSMILTPVYVNGVEDDVGLNWYDYNTGNETRNEYSMITTANGSDFNSSIARTQQVENLGLYNYSWYYDGSGFLLRYDVKFNLDYQGGLNGNASIVFSQIEQRNGFVMRHEALTHLEYTNYTRDYNFGATIVTGTALSNFTLEALPETTYNLTSGQNIRVIPLIFTQNEFDDIGVIDGEYVYRTYFSNETLTIQTTDFKNGTIIEESWPLGTDARQMLYVYYAPDIQTVAWIHPNQFPSQTNSLQLHQAGSFGKELLEFHYIQPQQAIDPTKTETPYWWPSIIVLALIPILVRKRS